MTFTKLWESVRRKEHEARKRGTILMIDAQAGRIAAKLLVASAMVNRHAPTRRPAKRGSRRYRRWQNQQKRWLRRMQQHTNRKSARFGTYSCNDRLEDFTITPRSSSWVHPDRGVKYFAAYDQNHR